MSDDNWLARQYERTGATVAKWPAYMQEMLEEERGKRTVSEHLPGDNRLPILGNDTIRDLPVSAFDTVMSDYAADAQQAELAALRQEKDEAIGAALQVEQKCYDQAQEIKTLRETIAARERNLEFRANLITEQRNELIKAEAELAPLRALREAVETYFGKYPFSDIGNIERALAACNKASAAKGAIQ